MLNSELFSNIQEIAQKIGESVREYSGIAAQIQQYIFDHFGQTGLYAAYISAAAFGLLIFWKLVTLSFAVLKYMVIPSVALAFLGSLFLPYSFETLLPVTATGCSLFLIFKA